MTHTWLDKRDLLPEGAEQIHDLASVSAVEAAHRGHARAVEGIRELEGRLEARFRELHEARQKLKQRAGVDAVTHFSEPLTAAWERWLATHEARERASGPKPEQSDEAREDEAMRIASAGQAE